MLNSHNCTLTHTILNLIVWFLRQAHLFYEAYFKSNIYMYITVEEDGVDITMAPETPFKIVCKLHYLININHIRACAHTRTCNRYQQQLQPNHHLKLPNDSARWENSRMQ